MGRSQETFSKKEKEKKKLRKRQDKEAKKEDRKANSSKGKELDEMMAYVDENGNITETPPDPTKKKKVIKTRYRLKLQSGPNFHFTTYSLTTLSM